MSRKYQYIIWHHDTPLDLCTSKAELDQRLRNLEAQAEAGRGGPRPDDIHIETVPWGTIP